MHDHNSLTTVMAELYNALFCDYRAITGLSFERDLRRVQGLLGSGGPLGLLRFMKKHEDVLIGFLRTGAINPEGVKHDVEGFPVFMNSSWRQLGHTCEVCRTTYHDGGDCSYHSCRCRYVRVGAYANLKQALALFKKAEIAVDPGPSLEGFVDRMVGERPLEAGWMSTVDRASEWLRGILPDLDPNGLLPYTSSGAVFERMAVLDRVGIIQRAPATIHAKRWPGYALVGTDRRSRAVAVPKDASKVRVVFVEPAAQMNLQQAIRRFIEHEVERSPLARRIRFDDQVFQQNSLRLPGRSSIDLSDASDWLDRRVIWRFFRHHPHLRSALFWSRSRECDVRGQIVPVNCYSTMGNATTFTVMSLFLACLLRDCEEGVRLYTGYKSRAGTVFGDDIVCDDVVAGSVMTALRGLGLKPSPRKCFIGTRFRESCGLDLLEDETVVPLAVKRWRVNSSEGRIARLAYSNQAHRLGLWYLAEALIADLPVDRLPVNTASNDTCLFSFSRGWDARQARWFAKEQRFLSPFWGPRTQGASLDNEAHLSYALVNGRLRSARVRK